MPFVTQEDSLGKALMLTSTERMTQFLSLMRRFKSLTWDEVEDIITVGVWDSATKKAMLHLLYRQRDELGVLSPGLVPNLSTELRVAVPDSFHVADRLGGVTGIGSMVFEPQISQRSWRIYNPSVLTANFVEGNFGRISGVPGSGKTNTACVMMEQWAREGNVAFSNILPKEEDERYFYCRDAKDLFTNISQLEPNERWLFVLDEAGLMYSRPDQATRRVKDLDKLMRVIRKLHGSMVLIEQRPESVPMIIQDFAKAILYCEAPGVVHIELKGPHLAFRDTVKDFPKTTLPFQTYDIAYFNVDINIVSMLSSVSGSDEPHKAMRDWMATNEPENLTVEQEAEQEIKIKTTDEIDFRRCQHCEKPLTEKQILYHAKYCSTSCRNAASVERTRAREMRVEA